MSDLFDVHSEVKRTACDEYAQRILGSSIRPLSWQGHYSYTVESEDGNTIIQFRSRKSPLNREIVELAKKVHPQYVPAMVPLESVVDSTVSVWKMDKIPGTGFLAMIHDDDIRTKLLRTVEDMATYYASAWKCPQTPSLERKQAVRQECETKLAQLAPYEPLKTWVSRSKDALDEIMEHLPWVLTHGDLSSMNMLLDAGTGRLQGIVDWAEAAIWPFGIGLWGLESVMGYQDQNGWTWLGDGAQPCRALFFNTFQKEINGLSTSEHSLIEKARVLGLLLRYGFVWRDETMVPTDDSTMLEAFLDLKDAVFK